MERRKVLRPVNPDEGIVLDGRNDPTHPLVRGRTRPFPSALEIATTENLRGNPKIDHVVLKSVGSMDGKE